MTQLECARKKKITDEMREVARIEGAAAKTICERVAAGRVVIPFNRKGRSKKICGIGEGLRTKVNANIGITDKFESIAEELMKLKVCVEAGADTVMDLSCAKNGKEVLAAILNSSALPVGTVPIYEAAVAAITKEGNIAKMNEDDIFGAIECHAKAGVDFFTIHAGVTRESVARLKSQKRIMDVVSRGGVFLIEWMSANRKENPLYENFKIVLDIAKRYDVTISLGDGMRPGSIIDATDSSQIQELMLLAELSRRSRDEGVQVMIEGPGHVPLNQIETNVILEKRLCDGAPFYVLGPLVTDVAPGYDHITAAIGGAQAAASGADFLCYVTPSEHLRLPTLEDVREGIIASRIAAHAGDIAKGVKNSEQWDAEISRFRRKRDWDKQFELAIDPVKPRKIRKLTSPGGDDVCTMCNQYCSMKLLEEALKR